MRRQSHELSPKNCFPIFTDFCRNPGKCQINAAGQWGFQQNRLKKKNNFAKFNLDNKNLKLGLASPDSFHFCPYPALFQVVDIDFAEKFARDSLCIPDFQENFLSDRDEAGERLVAHSHVHLQWQPLKHHCGGECILKLNYIELWMIDSRSEISGHLKISQTWNRLLQISEKGGKNNTSKRKTFCKKNIFSMFNCFSPNVDKIP